MTDGAIRFVIDARNAGQAKNLRWIRKPAQNPPLHPTISRSFWCEVYWSCLTKFSRKNQQKIVWSISKKSENRSITIYNVELKERTSRWQPNLAGPYIQSQWRTRVLVVLETMKFFKVKFIHVSFPNRPSTAPDVRLRQKKLDEFTMCKGWRSYYAKIVKQIKVKYFLGPVFVPIGVDEFSIEQNNRPSSTAADPP